MKAAENLTRPKRGEYYDAPTAITVIDGVTVTPNGLWRDAYRGTAQDLAACGLLALDQFPGMPGRNCVSVTLRPKDARPVEGQAWFTVPGFMFVTRVPSGHYRILLTVDKDEHERRMAEANRMDEEKAARELEAAAAAEEIVRVVPRCLREICESLDHYGRVRAQRELRDPAYLVQKNICPDMAKGLLSACELYNLADIERRMIKCPMQYYSDLANKFIAKIARPGQVSKARRP
jgi:hypothetical protein